MVTAVGGKVLGRCGIRSTPSDFSSFLLQAQASGAKSSGWRTPVAIPSTAIKRRPSSASPKAAQSWRPLVFITDVHALGLQEAQGLMLTEAFYWDMNDGTRKFTQRFSEEKTSKMPNMIQAGVYSSTSPALSEIGKRGGRRTDTTP